MTQPAETPSDTPEPQASPVQSAGAAAKPSKKKAKEVVPDIEYGMVIYSDGSAQQGNPGFGGWGIHGYIYSDQAPSKGHGNSTQYLTTNGYQTKSVWNQSHQEKPKEVKPLFYVNGLGSIPGLVSNNVAEIVAATEAMAFAARRGVQKLLIKTDSKYTVEGSSNHLEGWKRNHWIKYDGQPVKNREHWEALDRHLSQLKTQGCEVKVVHVRGHSHHLGNNIADKNADYGARFAIRGETRSEVSVSPSDGFWTNKVERHPFLFQRNLVFSTNILVNLPGHYYLAEMDKNEDLFWKRISDARVSYVRLAKPDIYVEALRGYQAKIGEGEEVIVRGRLDKLFTPDVIGDLDLYGEMVFVRANKGRLDLNFVDDEPLTRASQPALLSYRAAELMNKLQTVYDTWEESKTKPAPEGFCVKDITDVFYTSNDKGETILKPEFIVGFTTLAVAASYSLAGQKQEASVNLVLGHDLPERNALKKLEKVSPRLYLVTWMESEKAFRYATVCEAGPDSGVWASFCSNLRLVQPTA